MGCILARQGLKVVIIDTGTHPRFALGESTIGETTYMLRILAERYDVPEIAHCSSLSNVQKHVTSACGIKRNFGFVYQHKNQIQNPDEVTQCNVSEFPFGAEMHYYRQDIDAYLFHSAIKYGAIASQRTQVKTIQVEREAVTLTTSTGEIFEVAYVVDASGYDSVLARQLNLRENPSRFKTHSRSLFTHMIGVKPYDDCTQPIGQPTSWHSGTLHHIFDGGWVWVIPFNNDEHLTNPLCSVGVNFDSQRFPKPDYLTPQQEWDRFLAQFPSIAEQFADARPVRDWVSTARTQFSSTQTVGDRWCMMSHDAAGVVNALFSRGMSSTTQVVNSSAALILQAFKDSDFSAKRFEYLDRLNQNLLDYNGLVHGSYIAFRDFDLWRAWSKVWFLSWNLASSRIAGTFLRYLDTHDLTLFDHFEQSEIPGSFCPDLPEFQTLFAHLSDIIDRVEDRQTSPQEGVKAISETFEMSEFVPTPLNLTDVLRQYHDGSLEAS
jgi:tetracycline 7-halogenase / FADH2 O2-dependent halogenase